MIRPFFKDTLSNLKFRNNPENKKGPPFFIGRETRGPGKTGHSPGFYRVIPSLTARIP
jgi:hypothetical protein